MNNSLEEFILDNLDNNCGCEQSAAEGPVTVVVLNKDFEEDEQLLNLLKSWELEKVFSHLKSE